jgi:DNA-binding transcriptional LysR family regulator
MFQRVNGRLRPTPAADQLLPFVQRALAQLDAAQRAAYQLRGGTVGEIVIAVGGPALVSLLPVAIQRFHAEHPQIRVVVQIETTRDLIDKVSSNMADIGLGTPPTMDIDARTLELCSVRDLCRTQLAAIIPRQHPLARKTVIRPADLAKETIISLTDASTTAELADAAFRQAGTAPHIPILAANAIGVCSLVQQGIGIGLVNQLMLAQGIFPGVVARPFRPMVLLRTCLYRSKLHPLSRLAKSFTDHLLSTAKTIKGSLNASEAA